MHRLFPPPSRSQQTRRDAADSDRRIRIGRSSVLTAAMSPGGRGQRRAVRERWCRARPPDAARRHEPGAERPRRAVVGADDRVRFTAAALVAGVESRVTAHSGRVGLASELTSRGASTTDVMLAGNWKTSRMVAHYSAGATAERGAVARYL